MLLLKSDWIKIFLILSGKSLKYGVVNQNQNLVYWWMPIAHLRSLIHVSLKGNDWFYTSTVFYLKSKFFQSYLTF